MLLHTALRYAAGRDSSSRNGYLALAGTVVPMFATMRLPDDPSDAELMAAVRDDAKPLEELKGPLQRYAMRRLASGGAVGRTANDYRDGAIR